MAGRMHVVILLYLEWSGLTNTEASGPGSNHESDEVSSWRMKTESAVTQFAHSRCRPVSLWGHNLA